jgi:hypothetical protein
LGFLLLVGTTTSNTTRKTTTSFTRTGRWKQAVAVTFRAVKHMKTRARVRKRTRVFIGLNSRQKNEKTTAHSHSTVAMLDCFELFHRDYNSWIPCDVIVHKVYLTNPPPIPVKIICK